MVDIGQVDALLAAGAPVNSIGSRGSRPLDVAASNAHTAAVISALIRSGADALRSPTVLHLLLGNPSFMVDAGQVRALLAPGASLTARDDSGGTPLDVAASMGHSREVVQVLVQ